MFVIKEVLELLKLRKNNLYLFGVNGQIFLKLRSSQKSLRKSKLSKDLGSFIYFLIVFIT